MSWRNCVWKKISTCVWNNTLFSFCILGSTDEVQQLKREIYVKDKVRSIRTYYCIYHCFGYKRNWTSVLFSDTFMLIFFCYLIEKYYNSACLWIKYIISDKACLNFVKDLFLKFCNIRCRWRCLKLTTLVNKQLII